MPRAIFNDRRLTKHETEGPLTAEDVIAQDADKKIHDNWTIY